MYKAYLHFGYKEEFVLASKNNWGLDGFTIAKAIVKATEQADKVTKNRLSKEWFNAYRDALQEIIYKNSPVLNNVENSENLTIEEKKNLKDSKHVSKSHKTESVESSQSTPKVFEEKVLKKKVGNYNFLSETNPQNEQLKEVVFLKLLNNFLFKNSI